MKRCSVQFEALYIISVRFQSYLLNKSTILETLAILVQAQAYSLAVRTIMRGHRAQSTETEAGIEIGLHCWNVRPNKAIEAHCH